MSIKKKAYWSVRCGGNVIHIVNVLYALLNSTNFCKEFLLNNYKNLEIQKNTFQRIEKLIIAFFILTENNNAALQRSNYTFYTVPRLLKEATNTHNNDELKPLVDLLEKWGKERDVVEYQLVLIADFLQQKNSSFYISTDITDSARLKSTQVSKHGVISSFDKTLSCSEEKAALIYPHPREKCCPLKRFLVWVIILIGLGLLAVGG